MYNLIEHDEEQIENLSSDRFESLLKQVFSSKKTILMIKKSVSILARAVSRV